MTTKPSADPFDPTPGKILGGYAGDALSPERVKSWKNPTTGLVRAQHDKEWGGNSFRITGVNADGKPELQWVGDNNRGSGINAERRMVENIQEELDAPGEWFYDRDTGKLYLRQAGDRDPNGSTIGLGELNKVIVAEGDERGAVHDITFSGIEITRTHRTLFNSEYEKMLLSDWGIVREGAVTLSNTERVNVVGSTFRQIGGNAVMLTGRNIGNKIDDNEFREIGASAVVVAGLASSMRSPSYFDSFQKTLDVSESGPASDDYPRQIHVGRNLITDIGNYELQVAGVQVSLAQDVTITQNTIHDTPRAAINFNEGSWGGHVVSKNDIWNTVQETGDHGPINAWGRDRWWPFTNTSGGGYSKNTPKPSAELRAAVRADVLKPITIEQNRIWHNSSWAIDLDDGSSRYVVRNNLLLNSGIKLRDGFERTVENNILVGGRIFEQVSFEDNGDSIERNIVLGSGPYSHHGDIAADPRRSKTVYDSNLFWNNGSAVSLPGSLDSWRAKGADIASLIADPELVAGNPWQTAGLLDFTVAPDSPAIGLGFRNIPMNEFGRPGTTGTPPPTRLRGSSSTNTAETSVIDWLGAKLTGISDEAVSSVVGLPVGQGRLVKDVPAGSAAAEGGLQANDVIVGVGSVKVTDQASFTKAWQAVQPGTEVTLKVSRLQNPVELKVTKS
ncbi:PDZ domain-containing protein [Tsukamurella strandjordii]|uniref:PDZ domain-containing protein n=1 Tax=Tsukamurella TaxID=2060 RepID=UPI001C7DDC5E|nr:PDZ domain-containing protein [Tsukamurella sp. TY48]GIZ99209.1 peptide-binding protein [Tsukamurella sp. TY48]